MSSRLAALLIMALGLTSVVSAAEPVRFSGSVRIRAEGWNWFETEGFEDSYTYFASLIRASASQQAPRYDWMAELAQPTLLALPDRAVAPAPAGQLGFGGTYYAANDADSNVATIFVKQAAFRFKWPGHALRVGRFEMIDGTEVAPKDAALAAIKAQRVAHRLIGNFGFTHVGRSFDGVHYVHTRPDLNVTAALVVPTVGAFDADGMGEIDDVRVAYGAVTHSQPRADSRLFLIGYMDDRSVLKTDNRPQAVRAGDRQDIEIFTLGGHHLQAFGPANLLLWGAWQTGEWGLLDHNATAIDIEVGYNAGGPLSTSMRGGVFRSSGDDNPNDGDHGTFFQILPTARAYARFPFYNAMNSTDMFVQLSIKPMAKLAVAGELHRLRLTEKRDLWYAGGGAFQDQTFGFAGRPSSGRSDLAVVADLNLDYAFTSKTTFTLYLAAARGGQVIDSIYDGRTGTFAYFEVLRRF